MQSNMLWGFCIVLAIILLAFIGAFIYLKKLGKDYDNLKKEYNEIQEIPIEETLAAVKKMHLIGVSQASLEEWETKYNTAKEKIAELGNDFEELSATINKYSHLKHSKQFLEYLQDSLSDLNIEIKDIYEGLHKLRASEQQNSERIQSSVDLMQDYQNQVKNNKDDYGVALPEMQKKLTQVKNTFDEFERLNKNGDPIEAAKIVQRAEKELETLTELMEAIPPLNNELEVIFVDQIKDLTSGYHRLQELKFKFPKAVGDIAQQLRHLREEREKQVKNLQQCDTEVVLTNNRHLRQTIDHLYDVMQKEVDSKTYVDSTQSVVTDFIEHALKNNRQLTIELDHAAQGFVFHDNEMGVARQFQHEIEQLQIQNDEYARQLEHKEAVYSEVEVFYKRSLEILEDIENQQVAMDKTIVGMEKDLKDAEKAFEQFEFKMRTYKRYVEKHRLPGLPKDYLDYFFLVTDHIERLGVELGKIRVDTLLLKDYINKINREVQDVAKRTNELIDNAMLAEQYLQYANRYRMSHHLQETLDQALALFNSYQYAEAKNLTKTALEHIEPQAVERISDFYNQEKEVIE